MTVFRALLRGEAISGENVERRHADHRRGCRIEAGTIGIILRHCRAERREIHHVAGHARPDPTRGAIVRENSDTGGQLTRTERT